MWDTMLHSSTALDPRLEAICDPSGTLINPTASPQASSRLYSIISWSRHRSHSSGMWTIEEKNWNTGLVLGRWRFTDGNWG